MRISKDPEIRKFELIEAAEALFRGQGYRQTSVNDIVKKVGVAQGTFYYYFESKDDILDAVINHYIDSYQKSLEHLLSQEGIGPCQKIEIIASTALAMHKYDPKLVEFLHTEENLVTHQRYTMKSFAIVIPLITAIVEQGKAAGVFDVKYPRESVEMLVYAFGYLEDSVALSGDGERHYRMIQAAEDIVTRVLGIKDGQFRLDPTEAAEILQLIHSHAPLPEA
jgi:AcrR family transcriptional regulator